MKPRLYILAEHDYHGGKRYWWWGSIPFGATRICPVGDYPIGWVAIAYLGRWGRAREDMLKRAAA